eukprot:IDg11531t1
MERKQNGEAERRTRERARDQMPYSRWSARARGESHRRRTALKSVARELRIAHAQNRFPAPAPRVRVKLPKSLHLRCFRARRPVARNVPAPRAAVPGAATSAHVPGVAFVRGRHASPQEDSSVRAQRFGLYCASLITHGSSHFRKA